MDDHTRSPVACHGETLAFLFAWLLVANGIAFVIYSILSRHLRNDLLPTKQDWRSIGHSIIDHLRLGIPQARQPNNTTSCRIMSYLGSYLFPLPLHDPDGFWECRQPWIHLFPGWWISSSAGNRSGRFTSRWPVSLVLFIIIHVFEVIVTGFWNNLRSMLTGWYKGQIGRRIMNR